MLPGAFPTIHADPTSGAAATAATAAASTAAAAVAGKAFDKLAGSITDNPTGQVARKSSSTACAGAGKGQSAAEAKLSDAARGSAAEAAVSCWPAPAAKPPASTAVPAAASGQPSILLPATPSTAALRHNPAGLPVEAAAKFKAPAVPPPCSRDHAVHAVLELETTTKTLPVSPLHRYTWWTFDGCMPGPLVRCRVGDTLEVRYTNKDADGIGHNIDFHAVTGPGGGAAATYAEAGETKVALFKMLDPGLFIYHCAAAPLPTHVANGMYGMTLVEPEGGLPSVDKEFCVVQSEVYAQKERSLACWSTATLMASMRSRCMWCSMALREHSQKSHS